MKLSICIVNYKSRDELISCLESLQKFPPRAGHEIIVVDNDSGDGSARAVADLFPRVWLIQNHSNVGFGRASNQAIRAARGEYILLLNPDTIVTERALDNLLLVAENTKNLGTLGATLTYPDGTRQPSAYQYFPGIVSELRKFLFLEKIFEKRVRQKPRTRVAWSWGAALLFKRRLKGELVQMDPSIFLYSEDIELAWRLTRSGYQNYATSLARIVHAHNKSGEKLYGGKASPGRIRAFRDTLYYVKSLHNRGPFKKLRFAFFAKLVALNSLWRILFIPLSQSVRGQNLSKSQKDCRLAEHRTIALVFGRAGVGRAGLWSPRPRE